MIMESSGGAAMSRKTRSSSWWAILLILGAVMTLGSAVLGFVWLNRVPDLQTVAFGEPTQFTATGTAATIFTPTGLSTAPPCDVTTPDGVALELGEPERYQQSAGMESSYGFTASSGMTYTVGCGSPGQTGRFAVAEVSHFPAGVFVAVGSVGVILCAGAGLLVWRQRHAERSSAVTTTR
jgi:hypothetical protein